MKKLNASLKTHTHENTTLKAVCECRHNLRENGNNNNENYHNILYYLHTIYVCALHYKTPNNSV